jgi:proteasome lid subunit RPN8/RPN11
MNVENNPTSNVEHQKDIPYVNVPAVQFIPHWGKLYVQMNIKSYVKSESKKFPGLHQGFLFLIEQVERTSLVDPQRENSSNHSSFSGFRMSDRFLPKIRLVGDFPLIFHPHFVINGSRLGIFGSLSVEWIDYKTRSDEDIETDLESYVLRVARTLKYEDGYIRTDAKNIGNPSALQWYKKNINIGKFPSDDVCLPSKKHFSLTVMPTNDQPSSEPMVKQTRKVKFEVNQSETGYAPLELSKSDSSHANFEVCPDCSSDLRIRIPESQISHEFYLRKSAFDSIASHIEWRQRTEKNIVEQGGILLGQSYRDPSSGVIYGIVERIVSGKLARGTSSYLEVTHETWKAMLDEADKLSKDLQIIGWYHTHPNTLDVFMSGTDRATQKRLFGNDWQFAIVLNPHTGIWRSFFGSESKECPGYIIS